MPRWLNSRLFSRGLPPSQFALATPLSVHLENPVAFKFSIEDMAPGVKKVVMSGSLDAVSADNFEEAFSKIADDPTVERIVLDGGGVKYIASAGLRVLLKAVREMMKRNARLFGIHFSSGVLEVLKMTGFLKFNYITIMNAPEECLP
jgi:anti-sigma B factor antagonist